MSLSSLSFLRSRKATWFFSSRTCTLNLTQQPCQGSSREVASMSQASRVALSADATHGHGQAEPCMLDIALQLS